MLLITITITFIIIIIITIIIIVIIIIIIIIIYQIPYSKYYYNQPILLSTNLTNLNYGYVIILKLLLICYALFLVCWVIEF